MFFLKSAAVARRNAWALLHGVLVSFGTGSATLGDELLRKDIGKIFDTAEASGRVGFARKTKPVDARPATPGKVIETIIVTTIDGKEVKEKETESKPALAGDMVVRNRCPETGNEQYLVCVSAKNFAERYKGPIGDVESEGWREYHPVAQEMKYLILDDTDGDFVFVAPWGENMVARSGDTIVRTLPIRETSTASPNIRSRAHTKYSKRSSRQSRKRSVQYHLEARRLPHRQARASRPFGLVSRGRGHGRPQSSV
jgi:hypothetical protein